MGELWGSFQTEQSGVGRNHPPNQCALVSPCQMVSAVAQEANI